MSDNLNPLKFQVAIEDMATKQLENIKTKLNSLKNFDIQLNVVGADKIKASLNISETVSQIQKAINAVKGNNFDAFAKSIDRVDASLKTMTTTLQGLNAEAANSQNLQSLISGMSASVRNVRSMMQQVEGGKNSTASQADIYVRNVQKMEDALYRIQEARAKVGIAMKEGAAAGMNVDGMKIYMKLLDSYEKKLQNIRSNPLMMNERGWQTQTFGTTFKHLLSNAGDFQKMVNQYVAGQRRVERANRASEDSMRKAGRAVSDLASKFNKLELSQLRSKAINSGVDTSAYDKAIERMERYQQVLDYISKNGGHDPSRITGSVGYRNAVNDLNLQASALQKATGATTQLTAEQQRLSQALNQSNNEGRRQSMILNDLKSLATQYLGVWGGQQFLNNIIEIGGQLEMQRLSIGAILQNTAQANELFEKIKGMAVKSPFGVVELDQMTKQLTAYGFKYNELFDMTMRLADISAATGTGVDRLALALGHVRSEAALSGYTLRQFSMANVPLLQKLSEKLGKTTQEIRKMVRAKEISYEDVVGVLKDLTSEGGMFYNMQDVISESVKARFKNVKDAMSIMYGEMAEGFAGDNLKKIADLLMRLTKNWRDASAVLGGTVGVWGLSRAAILLYNKALGASNTSAIKAVNAYAKQEAANLRLASSYRKLTAAEKTSLRNKKELLVMGNALALSSKKLTLEDIARQVALGKLTKAEARMAIGMSDLTLIEKKMGYQMVKNVKTYGAFTGVINGGAMAVKSLGAAMKALLTNPVTWIMAAVSSIMYLWQHNKQEMEAAKQLSEDIYTRSTEGLKRTSDMMQRTGIRYNWRPDSESEWQDATANFGNQRGGQYQIKLPKFDSTEAKESIEDWKQYILDYAATPNRILTEALYDETGAVRDMADQFDRLAISVKEVAKSQMLLGNMRNIFEDAVSATNVGRFDGAFVSDVNTWTKRYYNRENKYRQFINQSFAKAGGALAGGLDYVSANNKKFADATQGMTAMQQYQYLIEHAGELVDARVLLSDYLRDKHNLNGKQFVADAIDKLNRRNKGLAKVEEKLNEYWDGLERALNQGGITLEDIANSPALQQALEAGERERLSGLGLTETQIKEQLIKFRIRFGLKNEEEGLPPEEAISDIDKMLNELTGTTRRVDITAATNVNDVIDKLRDQYNDAKKYYENAKPILAKFGIKFELGGENLSEEAINEILESIKDDKIRTTMEQFLKGLNAENEAFKQSETGSKKLGFSLEDPNKGSNKDKYAARWDERIRIMKEAHDWYDKWEKKVGKDEAFKEVEERYGQIFKAWREDPDKDLRLNFDSKNIEDYLTYVEQIRDAAYKKYQKQKFDETKNYGQEAERVWRQAVAILEDAKLDNFTRAAEEFSSKIEKTMDDVQRKWDIYQKVLSATGSRDVAWTMAGIYGTERNNFSVAEAIRSELEKAIGSSVDKIDFNTNLDPESVRKMLEEALPLEDKTKIDGLVRTYEKWQKAEIDTYKEAVDAYTKLAEGLVDTQSVVMKAEIEYQETLYRLQNLLDANPADYDKIIQMSKIATLKRDEKVLKAQSGYQLLMDGVVTMNHNAARKIKDDYVKLLDDQLRAGVITAKQYADELENINEKMRRLEELPSYGRSYMQGGISGVTDNMNQRGKSLMEQGSAYVQQGAKTMNSEMVKTGDYMQKVGSGMQNAAGKMNNTVAIIDLIVHGINDMVQGLKGVWDEINETLQAYGDDSQKTGMGAKVNTFLGAFSQASQGATDAWDALKSGNGAGVILGVVKSWTGWFKGFAEGHDAEMDEYIKNAQSNQKRLENIYSDIESDANRSFGYGTMSQASLQELRKERNREAVMRSFYGSGDRSDETFKAMNNALKSGSVYAGEYATLLAQRDSAQNKLASEQDKKDSDADDIEAYREEIAALNEQIAEFGKNLAKELWGIDVKGWADQIGDALMNAFENGEDAAKAFADVTRSILQGVASRILKLGILEPMMQKLEERLFGKKDAKGNYKGGSIDIDDMLSNPQSAGTKIAGETNKWFNEYGKKMIQAYQEGFISLNNLFDGALTNPNNNTLSSSIQGTAEETSDLLAGYVNTLRQDVAFNRLMLEQFISDMWPDYLKSIEAQGLVLGHIDTNVQYIYEMMNLGSGAMFDMISSIDDRLQSVIDVDKVRIN